MAEYIKRADALEAIRKWCGDCGSAIEAVLSVPAARGWEPDGVTNLPAADVVPVVHGMWEYIPQTLNTLSQLRCPFCRWWSFDPSIDGVYNYCPNCGAKMDGDSDES